jgi:hypothetical protein
MTNSCPIPSRQPHPSRRGAVSRGCLIGLGVGGAPGQRLAGLAPGRPHADRRPGLGEHEAARALGRERDVHRAEPVPVRAAVGRVGADGLAPRAVRERALREHAEAALGGERDRAIEGALVGDIDRALHGAEPAALDRPQERLVVAGVRGDPDLAGPLRGGERLDDVPALQHVERARVEVGDVEPRRREALEREIDPGADARAGPVRYAGHAVAELRRDHRAIAPAAQRRPDPLLRAAVARRGVDQRDAEIERGVDEALGGRIVEHARIAERTGAEPQRRDGEAGRAEGTCLHRRSLRRSRSA